MRFFSSKTRVTTIISLFITLLIRLRRFIGALLLSATVVVILSTMVLATTISVSAKNQKTFRPQTQIINIFPSEIESNNFIHIDRLYTQDLSENALFQEFNKKNSSFISQEVSSGQNIPTLLNRIPAVEQSPVEVVSVDTIFDPVLHASTSVSDINQTSLPTTDFIHEDTATVSEAYVPENDVESTDDPSTEQQPVILETSPSTEIPSEIISGVEPELPTVPPPDVSPIETQSVPDEVQARAPSLGSIFAIFKKVTHVFNFTQAVQTELLDTPAQNENISLSETFEETSIMNEVSSIDSLEPPALITVDDVADNSIKNDLPIVAAELIESTSTLPAEKTDDIFLRDGLHSESTPLSSSSTPQIPEKTVISADNVRKEGDRPSETNHTNQNEYSITLKDFGLPELESGQFITNTQLRLSLAGQYAMNASSTPTVIDVQYAFDDVSGNAGTILMEDEFSNALNGGYYLIPLPSITDPTLLKDLEIILTVHGEVNNIKNLYIDSAWVEVSTVVYDKKFLKERTAPQEMWKHLEISADMDFLSDTLDFTRDELPYFNLKYNSQRNGLIQAMRSLFGKQFAKIDDVTFIRNGIEVVELKPDVSITKDGIINVLFSDDDREQLKPGTYSIEIEVNEGGTVSLNSFEFQWGLLSINPLQTTYVLGDSVDINMGALTSTGNTICNADLQLYLIAPDGFISQSYVKPSGVCNGNNVIDVPDYSATYQTRGIGEYQMYLESLDGKGNVITHTSDTFLVEENPAMVIKRNGPTRIYPLAEYDNSLTIIDRGSGFVGTLVEKVPKGFVITNTDARITDYGSYTELVWDMNLSASSSQTVSYTFDAPDISPYLYTLGPAVLESNETKTIQEKVVVPIVPTPLSVVSSTTSTSTSVATTTINTVLMELTPTSTITYKTVTNRRGIVFTEHRQWQIASDAPEDYNVYTIVDPSGYITVASSTEISVSGQNNADSYMYRDMGVNWLAGDFYHDFDMFQSGTGKGKWNPWVVASTLGNAEFLKKNANDGYGVELKFKGGGIECKIIEYYTGGGTKCGVTFALNTWVYARVARIGTNLTLSVYSDKARTALITSATVVVAGETPRYVYGVNSTNKGKPDPYAGKVANLELYNFEQSGYRFFTNTNATTVGAPLALQDTPATLTATGQAFRLRMLLHATGSPAIINAESFNLQYAPRIGSCDVGFLGESYSDVTATSTIAFNNNATPIDGNNLTTSVNDPVHGADTVITQDYEELNSFTNSVASIAPLQDGLWDFSLIDNGATASSSYCFRGVLAGGTELESYSSIPEIITYSPPPVVTVSSHGIQISNVGFPTTGTDIGASFVFTELSSSSTITSINLTEKGTVDAQTDINNIKIFYDLDTSAPYDCASETYNGTESQYGTTDTNGFSAPNGTSTFTGSVVVNTTSTMCAYTVFDVGSGATNGDTFDVEISSPYQDVQLVSGTAGPSNAILLASTTNIRNDYLEQLHYHIRNDDGSESGATSATGGIEDTTLSALSLSSTTRIRIALSNEGSTTTAESAFGLEYATATSGPWTLVTNSGTEDWVMTDSLHLTNGNDTTNIAVSTGGVTDENTTFVSNNGAVVDTSTYTATSTVTSSEFMELEFALKATANAISGGTYYFRAISTGAVIESYSVYPGITLLSPDLQQMRYHFRNDNGSETLATSATGGLEDTPLLDLTAGTTTRLRFGISNEGVENAQNVSFQLEFATATSGPWTSVPTAIGEAWIMSDSPHITDGNDTTNIATSTGGVTDENTTFIANNNGIKDTSNTVSATTVSTSEFIELEYAIKATPNAASSTYYFRVTNAGAALNTYVVYPKVSLIFGLTQVHYRWRNDDGGESGANAGDGHMVYGDDAITTNIYNRTISGTTTGAEGTFALGANIGWVDIESSPINPNRLIRASIDTAGPAIQTAIYNNATALWTPLVTVSAGVGNAAQRQFDIEFEQSTGDALIVYSDNTNGAIRYRTMTANTSVWGAEQTLTFTGGAINTIRIVRDPDTDDIMLGWEDVNFDVFTALWDGAAFGAITTHELNSINQAGFKDPQVFDIAWEGGTSTSEALIAWIDNLAVTKYNTWTGGVWGTAATVPGLTFSSGSKGGMVVASTRWSEEHQKIAIFSGTGFDKKLRANVWSGSAWGSSVLLGAVGADMQADRALPVEAVWQKTSGNLFVPYIVKKVESGVRLKIYNSTTETWTTDSIGPLGVTGNFKGYVRADADVNSQAVTILAGDRNIALGTFSYVCGAPCNTGAVSEWTELEVDIDDGSDTIVSGDVVFFESIGATFRENEDTETVALQNELLRLRFEVNNKGTTTLGAAYRLEVSEPNPTTCSAGTYTRINTDTGWNMATSSYITDAEATFNINPGLTDEDTIFVAGSLKEIGDQAASVSLTATQFTELEYVIKSTASSTVGATYCFRVTNTGSPTNLLYAENTYGKVTLETSFTENYFRWYANENNSTPTDIWPVVGTDLNENEAISALYAPVPNDVLRLRTTIQISDSTLPSNAASFKLQYAEGPTCLASLSWQDVGAIGSSTALWRGHNNTSVVDGVTLASTVLSVSDKAETYEEENNSTNNPNAILPGEDGEYDWVIENNAAPQNTSYCFRMVTAVDREFQSYIHYPSLITNSSPDAPTLTSPFDNRKTASTSPPFDFISSDAAGNDIHYQIQVDDNYNFSSPVIDKNSVSNFLLFENTTSPSDKAPFDSGKNIRFSPTTALTNGTTYWWKVRAKDPDGSNEWSSWSTPWSFTVDTAVAITTWYQNTEAQFDTDTLVNVTTPTADNVQLSSGQTTGTTTSTAIDFDWHETGNAWGSLIWNDTETVGDIKHHVEYYASSSEWLLVPDSALAGNLVGFDLSPISILALDSDTYNQIRVRSNFTNIGGTPILNNWTVEWGLRVNQPTKTTLFDNEQMSTTTPLFEFYTTDPQADDVQYEISWSTTTDFLASTTRISGVHTGFTDVTNGLDTSPYTSGDVINYTIQSADALTASTTYWWRVRARDPLGSNVYSKWSTLWSYTVDSSTVVSTWFQTTADQFETDTLTGIYADATTNDARVQQSIGEYGTVTLTSNTWTTITTNTSYNDLVIVASPRYQPNANTERTPRIRNKTANSFDIKVDNISAVLAGTTVVDWMAIEAGSWTIQDGSGGTKIEAGTKNTAQVQCSKFVKVGGEKVTFNTVFIGPPAVLHTISSDTDITWVTSHVDGGGATSKDVPTETQMGMALNRSNETCTHGAEDIDYVAVDTVHGTNDGVAFDTNVGGSVLCCNTTGYINNFTSPFALAPLVTVVSQMGEQDGRGGYGVTHTGTAPSATSYYTSIDESSGGNRAHGKAEAVAIMSFANATGTIVRDTLTGVIESTSMDFDSGAGPFWDKVSWTDVEPGASSLLYRVLYLTSTSSWAVIPDSALTGNSVGFTTSPIDISGLSRFTYNELKLRGNFTCTLAGDCPVLEDWKVEWAAGVTVSGIARSYDQISSTTAGTVAIAVNGTIQVGKTGTIQANGTWSIADVTMFPGDVVTVFVSGALDADEAVDVTLYDGLGNLTGMELYKRHLTIGSDVSTSTPVTNSDIANYDVTNDEDLFFDVNGSNAFDICATTGCDDAGLIVLNNTTYQPGAGGNIITHDFENNGTFIPSSNTVRVGGSWDNNATTTMVNSTVLFTATSTVESIDSTGAITPVFYNVTFGETSGSAIWNLITAFDVDNILTVTYGTLARSSQSINIGGTLTNGASGFWTGIGTTTFDGAGTSNWSDQNTTLQNIGHVIIDGTSKAILLTGNVAAESIIIGSNDTLDAGTSNHDITVYGNWTNNNTFNARAATVFFGATSTGSIITSGGSSFYDLTFNGVGGSWSFATSTQIIENNFTVATGTVTMPTGTTTIGGSFSSAGGTFAHNNAVIEFNATGAETITASGTVFTNAFYDLNFNGSGSWTFVDTNATTSNDILIPQGTVTFPSGILTVGGTVRDTGGAFIGNGGTVSFTSAAAETIQAGGSSFNNITAHGSGSWAFSDTNVTATGDLTIQTGTVTLPSNTLTLGGSLANNATLVHNNGTILFNATATGNTIDTGVSALYNATFNSASGGWTITTPATTTNNLSLINANSFTLTTGKQVSVGNVFTNNVGGASTTWTGSTLSLESGAYSLNTKTDIGDVYGTLAVGANTNISMWNSSSTVYNIDGAGSLYSQDHSGINGDLYIYGSYPRTSGTEYWSYATDFDGTSLVGGNERQTNVRIVNGGSVSITNSTLTIIGSPTATTTIANQGSGTYLVSVHAGTTTAQYYNFADLGSSGLSLLASTTVTSLADGRFTPSVVSGTGLTLSSTTIDTNPALQIYRVNFSTTTAITATNVTQTDGTPASYWWFRQSSGNIDGEAYDNDTGDPGSVRWDDSSLVLTVSGTVYTDDGVTPLTGGTCDGVSTPVRIVIENGATYDGTCSAVDGSFSISGVTIVGDPTVTVFLNGASGGEKATVVTKTPTIDITDLDLYANRVITRHEDAAVMTIADMAVYDNTNDTDIQFIATTSTVDSLSVLSNTELYVWATSTFTPGGLVTVQANATGNSYDGSLHIGDAATFTGSGTTTYTIGGSLTLGTGATYIPASTTIVMNATTTGKTINTASNETLSVHTLQFIGIGGGWNINGNISSTANIDVTNGTVTGTGNITLTNGSLAGNGLLSLGGGTTTLAVSNTLGGTQAWTFNNLILGNGLVVGTTTPASTATTTVGGFLQISTAHFLNANNSIWNLSGSGSVLIEDGTLMEDTSTILYSGTGSTNILSTNYYNLRLDASLGSPTYTATGLGIQVLNNLDIGSSGTTTVNFTVNDPALNIDGTMTIGSFGTFIASNSGSLTLAGSYSNNGVFTGSGGTLVFDGTGTHTIAAGNSSFSTVDINGSGNFTVTENATATTAWILSAANNFTVNTGVTLAVGGTFTNTIGGPSTVWAGSTLHLYGGGNYQINASTTNDRYQTLSVGANTDIRMWNSFATTTSIHSSGSLYSQDHNQVNGNLYIYGDYVKTSGTDFWSYATDFDGTSLVGTERKVDVYIENGASTTYSGGDLQVLGTSLASTTIQNQGSGTYAFAINGTASTTWNYYEVRHTDSSGLNFSGTPNVVSLSYGDFLVSTAGGSGITVTGTVLDQNPAKTFTQNIFATSSAISAYNVTATGVSVSSWRFTNHVGNLAGEAYDVDPDGDPGYIVWDDSAANITISGAVYSDEGVTASAVCDGVTNNVLLRIAGLTTYQTSCNGTTGAYSISGVTYSAGDSLIVYINGEASKGAVVSEDPVSNINNMDIYENRVIARHEGTDSLSIIDMAIWDFSDDADIPFTALSGTPNTLSLPANTKLLVWANKEFAPGGDVTVLGGGGGAAYDGTLELYAGATWTGVGSPTYSIGGSIILGTGATFIAANSTTTFTTSGASRTIDVNADSFYNMEFTGTGSWNITDVTLIAHNVLKTSGSLTLPSGTTTISGFFNNSGGTVAHNGSVMVFDGVGAGNTVAFGGSDMGRLSFIGTGSWNMTDINATSTDSMTIEAGTVTLPSGSLTLGGSFRNTGGTVTHNTSEIIIATSSSATVLASSSDLYGVTFRNGGTFTLEDNSLTLLDSLTISSGSLALASGTLSIGGSFDATGSTFTHASGTILFNASTSGKIINPGISPFYNVNFGSASGGWTITGNATTSHNFTLTSASAFTQQSGTTLSVGNVFTNSVGGVATTWTGSTLNLTSGTEYNINAKTSTGDNYDTLIVGSNTDIRIWNSQATTTTVQSSGSLYSQDHGAVDGALDIFGDYHISTTTEYWSYANDFDGAALGGSARAVTVAIASGATTTVDGGTLHVIGASSFETTITNQGSGQYAAAVTAGTFNAQYYKFRNLNNTGLSLSGTPTITSLNNGDFELAVAGGNLISLASSTLNSNASFVITGSRFATTTAITGTNVNLTGSTANAWTFISHTGNLSGESYDIDGVGVCESIRWDDSSCLLTQQTHYRFRNDDGGAGAPDIEWFNTNWNKRKSIRVDNNDATAYTNAVVKLTVAYNANMKSDFSDLRFTDNSGTTSIPYFISSTTNSTAAEVWVEVPSLSVSGSDYIYMYYNNALATTTSSSTQTFIASDDFEDGTFTEYSGDTSLFTVDGTFAYGGLYGLDNTGFESSKATDGIARFDQTVSQGEIIRYMQYIDTGVGSGDEVCTLFGVQTPVTTNQNYAVCLEQFGVDRVSLVKDAQNTDSSGTILASSTVTYSTGWYAVEIDWQTDNSIQVTVSKNNSIVATLLTTDSTYTSGGYGFTYWFNNGGWDNFTSRTTVTTEPSVQFGIEQVNGGATWAAAQDTPTQFTPNDTVRLRLLVENSGLAITNQMYALEYAAQGSSPSCESVSSANYAIVPNQASCGSSPVCMQNSTNVIDGESISDLLTIDTGAFTLGELTENPANTADALHIAQGEYTELEYVLTPTSNISDENMCLRVSNSGVDLDTYLRVAKMTVRFDPSFGAINFNAGTDIALVAGATTTIYATSTVTDLNGYSDLQIGSSTMYTTTAGAACTADNNDCYIASTNSTCSFTDCSGNSCVLSCSADFYFHADATDTDGANQWWAFMEVEDTAGGYDFGTSPSQEVMTLRALDVTNAINYGSLAASSTSGTTNASTTVENLGNVAIDIDISGTDLIDGYSSNIPASEQIFATSTFDYVACVTCTTLATTAISYNIDLVKPTSTVPAVADDVFWGIQIPFGVSSNPHTGGITFTPINVI